MRAILTAKRDESMRLARTSQALSRRILVVALVGVTAALLLAQKTVAQNIIFRQFGSPADDLAYGVAVDGTDNAYVVGYTVGTLSGQTSAGNEDAFVRKYDANATEAWTRQFGTSASEVAYDVAVDTAGNAYVAGYTDGALPGQEPVGERDAFLRKYDPSGAEVWTQQFGTPVGDVAYDVAVDAAGNPYVAGYANGALPGQTSEGATDAFLRKYDPAGNEVWTRQFGTSQSDAAYALVLDGSGNAYVAGNTDGPLSGQPPAGGLDAYVRKYDAAGTVTWTRQFGTSGSDFADGIAVDTSGNVHVTGRTYGAFSGQTNAGYSDAYVRKFDAAGAEAWTRQFGTSDHDWAPGAAVDLVGNAYVVGYYNSFTVTGVDAYVRKYDSAGSEVWTRQFGGGAADLAEAVTVNSANDVYVAGTTHILPGQTPAGCCGVDAYMAKMGQLAGDTDQDGCTDVDEAQTASGSEASGGRRNAKYFWDFYDVWTRPDPMGQPNLWTRDKVVTIPGDIFSVAQRFGAMRSGGAPTKQEALSEALTPPTSNTGYHTDFDRGPPVGPNIWDSGPPDGAITIPVDIFQVARQFGHSCL